MYAKCIECKLPWNISTRTDLSKPYVCPKCKAKENKVIAQPIKHKRNKSEGRISGVLQRNREKFSISNS